MAADLNKTKLQVNQPVTKSPAVPVKQKQGEKVVENSSKTIPSKKMVKQKKKFLGSNIFKSVYVLAIVNVIGVVFLVLLLNSLQPKAIELKEVRNLFLTSQAKSKVELADLEIQLNVEKSDQLIALFPNESGLIDFVKEIERLQKNEVIKKFSFANKDAVRDKTKNVGIPFLLDMEGTWQQIGNELENLQKLPFMLRAITVEAREDAEDSNLIRFKYGGFIYVDESLEKN